VLSAKAESELHAEGARLDLQPAAVSKIIDELLVEAGAVRSEDDRDEIALLVDSDLYAVLQVEASASPADLEAAGANVMLLRISGPGAMAGLADTTRV
jgi:hypothetical protein